MQLALYKNGLIQSFTNTKSILTQNIEYVLIVIPSWPDFFFHIIFYEIWSNKEILSAMFPCTLSSYIVFCQQ